MQLVYLSPVPWASFAQRPQKFVEWFHGQTDGRVLWLDPYPTRFPSLADLCRLRAPHSEEGLNLPPWLTLLRPRALPLEPLPGSAWLNRHVWSGMLATVDAFARREDTLVGVGKPSALALAVMKRLENCPSVYDAMDDFPAFYSGFSRWAMCRREREVVRCASHMLVSSTTLKERWSDCRSDLRLVRNGLDTGLIPTLPSRERCGSKLVFGYLGTIASWFDWECLLALAEARSEDIVRLIGPVFGSVPADMPGNVEFLPPCDHRSALLAMCDFDVGLIPFRKNALTESVDPIKYYEYRALGLPVLSTAFGEMIHRKSEEGVYLVERREDLAVLAEAAIAHRNVQSNMHNFVCMNSWEARFAASGILGI